MTMDMNHYIAMALFNSVEALERRHNQRAMEEAAEREWPSLVLEDILDADEVKERTYFKPNPIIDIGNII